MIVVQPIAWVFGYLEDPRKMMFGTDWPLVFHDNAVRVFRLQK